MGVSIDDTPISEVSVYPLTRATSAAMDVTGRREQQRAWLWIGEKIARQALMPGQNPAPRRG